MKMLNEQIDLLIKQSMLDGSRTKTEVLRAIKTTLTNFKTSKNAIPLTEAIEINLVKKLYNDRIESGKQYALAGRGDLQEAELNEASILHSILTDVLGVQEVTSEDILKELISTCKEQGYFLSLDPYIMMQIPKKEMGTIIKILKAKLPSADGKTISSIVKEYVV